MFPAIKAEFLKLLTIRSTYCLTILAWAIAVFVAAHAGVNWHGGVGSDGYNRINYLSILIYGFPLAIVASVSAIVAILSAGHEYRYNLINYGLTLNRSRTGVLAAKLICLTVYAIFLCLVAIGLMILSFYIFANAAGQAVNLKYISWPQLLGENVFFVWTYAIYGLVITVLLRNIVASLGVFFILPTLVGIVTKLFITDNLNYLPFAAAGHVRQVGVLAYDFSVSKAIVVVLLYMAVFGCLAWALLLRRDAV